MILLCRHALTEANRDGKFLSRTDLPLSEEGRAQCVTLAQQLAGIEIRRAFVSPMRRCRETLALAAPRIEAIVREELREIDFGDWEGMTLEQVLEAFPGEVERRRAEPVTFRPPNGESFSDVANRIRSLANDIIEMRETALVVSHRGTLAVLERILRGFPLAHQGVAAIEPSGLRIVSPSDVPHQVRPSASSNTSLQ